MKPKTEASQAVDARNAVIDECIAALTVHLSHTWRPNVTVRNAIFGCREVVAALKAQPAPTEPQDEKKPFAWAYRAIGSGDWRATMDYKWAHAIEGMETKPLYDFPTEAALPDRHALQAEGKHPAPCARHCEATAFGIEIRRLGAENERLRAAQGEDSARLELMQYTAAPGVEIAGIVALLANAREMAARAYRPKPNWVVACSLFDVRPQESIEICSIAGIDPYALKIDRARASAETGGVKS